MRAPTIEEIDELVCPATPHFAFQLRLGHASSKADEGSRESRGRLGWETIPSSAPADSPLPTRR